MSDKTSILLVYLNEAIASAQSALTSDNLAQSDAAVSMYNKAAASLSKAKLFSSDCIQPSIATLISTYQLRIQDLNNTTSILMQQQLKEDTADVEILEDPEPVAHHQPNQLLLKHIAGLEKAKQILLEAIILPRKFPYLYSNMKPWNKLLLYGPPGTGKTKLVQAIASEARLPVLSVTSADLLSKWFGASERLIQQTFQQAKEKKSILFVDEIDSLLMKRTDNEDENTRRIKNEFLLHMDACNETTIIACTNRPWDLDFAVMRRFQKKLYIPLPNEQGRKELIKLAFVEKFELDEESLQALVCMTEGFSGSDITLACQEALQVPITELVTSKHFKEICTRPSTGQRVLMACKENDPGAVAVSLLDIDDQYFKVLSRPLNKRDIMQALSRSKPSVPAEEIAKYDDYTAELGPKTLEK